MLALPSTTCIRRRWPPDADGVARFLSVAPFCSHWATSSSAVGRQRLSHVGIRECLSFHPPSHWPLRNPTWVITVTITESNVDSVAVNAYSNSMDATWTLETLTQRIDAVLRQEGIHQHNGQVAEAPNARAIRWYQSTGLLRRPEQRGRVAFYGPAHLAEVVAIKRLQATGLSLVDVQTRLQGLNDDALFALANVPAVLAAEAVATPDADSVVVRRSFWDGDVADADVHPFVVPEPEPAILTTRQIVDHPSGVSLVLPHTIDAAVASMMLRRLVDELVAGGHLPTTSPAPDATDGAATREKP